MFPSTLPRQLVRCLFAFFVAVFVAPTLHAQESEAQRVKVLVPTLLGYAESNRRNMLQHPSLSAYDLDAEIHMAFGDALKSFKADIPRVIVRLDALQSVLRDVPLKAVPNWEMQGLLAALARHTGRIDDLIFHRAYRVALIAMLQRSGDGKSPQTAMKIIGLREPAAWFAVNSITPKTKSTRTIDDKRFDVWLIEVPNVGEQELYFDLSLMDYSVSRLKGIER